MPIEAVLTELQTSNRFPAHGWIKDPDSSIYLIFPVFRLTHVSSQSEPSRPVTVREVYRTGFFREMFFRVLAILDKIATTESIVRISWPREGISIEEFARWNDAHQFLPIYVEMFYIYFRLLADRLVVALAPTVSDSVGSFPREYKALLQAANDRQNPNWGWRMDPCELLAAIRDHSEWYTLLVGPIGSCPKGIRDTLNHRLVRISPAVVGFLPEESHVELRFEGTDRDIPNVELFSMIGTVVHSFCTFLSAIPRALWEPPNYINNDIVIVSKRECPAVTMFFPQIVTAASGTETER